MGYEVHIRRTRSIGNSAGASISLPEIETLVANDPELRLDRATSKSMTNPKTGQTITIGLPGPTVVWKAHPDGHEVPFYYDPRSGELSIPRPDDHVIAKMKEIASRLEAAVIGDGGGEY